jgi:hypothetical protein
MADDYVVSVKSKEFVGIGKFLFDTVSEEWNIPHLHFMVDRTDNGNFEATNLEFCLVSSGESAEVAAQRLAGLVHFHIISVVKNGNGYKEFIENANSRVMDDYWRAYRVIDFSLGEKGNDLSHEIEKRITRAIQEMFDRQVKEIIRQKAEKRADDMIKAYEELTIFKLTVQYAEVNGSVA